MSQIKIIIIDDHKLVRETWSFILNQDPRFLVLAESGTAEEGIELCKQQRPDLVILDINLPGMDGMEAVPLIKKYAPGTKIIGVSFHTQIAYVKKMIQNGASGYITKNSSRQEMTEALISVHEGRKYICKEIKDNITEGLIKDKEQKNNLNVLSLREMQIMDMIRQGLSSKEIAAAASIAVKTVQVHRYNILKKLKLKNAAALVNYMNENDFVLH